jgi:hypothetical protein
LINHHVAAVGCYFLKFNMPKRKVTHIGCFVTGDRFYLADDTTKTVWQVLYQSTTIATMQKKSRCIADNGVLEWFDSNKVVIHLRRAERKELVLQPMLFS